MGNSALTMKSSSEPHIAEPSTAVASLSHSTIYLVTLANAKATVARAVVPFRAIFENHLSLIDLFYFLLCSDQPMLVRTNRMLPWQNIDVCLI
jgi:hypothetical protein